MSSGREGAARGARPLRDAADWFVERDSGRVADRVGRLRWERWVAHPAHRADYDGIARILQDVGALPPPPQSSRAELLADAMDEPGVVVIPSESTGAAGRLAGRFPFFPPSGRFAAAGIGLALVLCCAAWLLFFGRELPGFLLPVQAYATAPGEQRGYLFPDGSTMTLGGDTRLVVHFDAHTRSIELERGAAFFQVEHDPQRPFVVHAVGGTATAIGTSFEVRKYGNRVQVWVRDGAVAVVPMKTITMDHTTLPDAARLVPVRLARGEEMSYDEQGESTAPQQADPRVTAAWVEGQLVPLIYHGRPLPEVIEDIQLYTRRRITIDPGAGDFQYSGVIKQQDVEAWIRDLASIYPVEVLDCQTSRNRIEVRGCDAPETIVIRPRAMTPADSLRSAER